MRVRTRSIAAWMLAAGIAGLLSLPDPALSQAPYYEGETITLLRKDIAEKLHFHATIMNPKGTSDPRFPDLADLEAFTKSEKVRKVIDLFRAFQYPRWPIHLAPGTPKALVKILREAVAKSFKDPGFHQEFKKLMGREPTPVSGEEVEKAVRELPREAEVIAFYKMLAESAPLPPR